MDNKIGVVIKADGTLERLDLSVSEQELKSLQNAVGGYVQVIELEDDFTMWVNEEGKLLNLPVNEIATVIWEVRFGIGTDIICGDVVFTGGMDEDGETLTISEANIQRLAELVEGAERGRTITKVY
jgi:hypothetical protein